MGAKERTRERPFKVNVKAMEKGNRMACFSELQTYMACLARNKRDLDACHVERAALEKCTAAALRTQKVTNTINYHLQRLSRQLKR